MLELSDAQTRCDIKALDGIKHVCDERVLRQGNSLTSCSCSSQPHVIRVINMIA